MHPTFRQITYSKKPGGLFYNNYLDMLEKTRFLPENTTEKVKYWYWVNNVTEIQYCECGCMKPLLAPGKTKYVQGHSNTSQVVKDKKRKIIEDRYGPGITNVSQIKDVKDKKTSTHLKNHGVKSPLDRKFIVPIWQKKYGVDNPSYLPEVRKKISGKLKITQSKNIEQRKAKFKIQHYNKLVNHPSYEPLFTIEEYMGNGIEHSFRCRKCDTVIKDRLTDGVTFRCYTCIPRITTGAQSEAEHDIELFCKRYEQNVSIANRDIIPPLEVDIFIPEKQIGIEYNGLYYHSECNGKGKFYHRKKTELCKEKGIRLLQIFEDEWTNKRRICESRIRCILNKIRRKVYARKCAVKIIDTELKDKFLKKYHIQGTDKSSLHYGLFYKNRLVAVMTFGKPRNALGNKNKEEEHWELVRYCTISNFMIVGGASKLLSHFKKNNTFKEITTYADLRWSYGNLYESLGFTYSGTTTPNYWYIVNNKRVHRFGYQKHTLKDRLNVFDENLTEWENMKANGYTRVWDCGHLKYIMRT
jgi:hypothetical protein